MIFTGVKKTLGNFSLCIDKLSLTMPGIYGLIGPNGSGKSTLAKIMAGLLEPDAGTVDTEGLTDRDITYLSRKPYMMDDTVYNNLAYPLQIRGELRRVKNGIKSEHKLINDFLGRMNFSKRAKQRANSLSGGEQQKLAFLRAIIFKPRLVIADEAMTAMDMDSLDQFEKIILEEQENEKSIWIIISHQMPHIKRVCGGVYFMFDGKIETEGSVQEIFSGVGNPDFTVPEKSEHFKKYLRSYSG